MKKHMALSCGMSRIKRGAMRTTQTGMDRAESTVWEGHPSYVAAGGTFVLCLLFAWLIFPIFVAFFEWLRIKNTHYRLTSERMLVTTGVLSKSLQQVELYRVRDISVEYPFLLRVFGKGNIRLLSTDRTSPDLVVSGIDNADTIKEEIRFAVEALRQKKRRIV